MVANANVVSLSAARSAVLSAAEASDRRHGLAGWSVHHRPRLARWLAEAAGARLICLQAPAGFGKTAVLDMWAGGLRTADSCIVRVACTGVETSVDRLLSALIGAFLHSRIALDPGSLREDDSGAALIESLVCQLDAVERPIELFIDEGASRLSAASLALLWELAARAARVRVFIASRRKPPAALARGRIQGQVAVLDAQQLSFNSFEARSLFEAFGISIGAEDLAVVMSNTAGWPVGLRILAATVSDGAAAARASAVLINRTDVADLFMEEVLAAATGDVGEFLVAVSILARLSPSLCDAVTGRGDGCEMLERLCDEGLFVLRLDEVAGYELHPLLRALLRARIDREPKDKRALRHLRASQWLDRNGQFIAAFEHAMQAEDIELAARILDAHCDDFYLGGLERSLLPTATLLPVEVRQRFPRIMLAMSWRMMAEWRFDQARALLECAQMRMEEMRVDGSLGIPDLRRLEYELKHRHVMQCLFQEDFARVVADGERLIREPEQQNNPYISMSLYAALMYAQREQFQLGQLDRLEGLARELLPNVPGRYVHILFESMVAPGKLLRGETDAGIVLLEAALQAATELSSPVGAAVALILSEARYTCNDLDAAQALLDDYLPDATDAGFVDQLISGHVTQARLHRLRGNVDGALSTLQEAETLAANRGFRRLGAAAFSERLALLCHVGQKQEAVRIAGWQGFKISAPPRAPEKGATREDNSRAFAWVRFAQACGRNEAALAVAKAWRNFTSAAKALADVVDWDILRAQLLLANNEKHSALRVLSQALALAAPARRMRPFVDEATHLAPMLESLSQTQLQGGGPAKFLSGILAAIAQEAGASAVNPAAVDAASEPVSMAHLTTREIGILRLVAAGHVNAEIGKRLGLTPGTVKWYLHQVYGKLGCQRRITAIEQGRRLGLID